MKLQDTQYTEDELALMRGEDTLPSEARAEATPETLEALTDDEPGTEAEPASADADTPAADVAPEPVAEAQEEGFIPKFDGSLPADFDAQKKTLRAEKADLRTQWSNGELSDDEFAAKEMEVDDKLEALQVEAATAKALERANQQIQAQQQQAVLKAIAAEAAKAGINYGDKALALVYDTKLSEVAGEADFKGKPFDVVAREAHERVAKLFGRAVTAPSGTKADGAKPNERVRIPQTLGDLPAAASSALTDDPNADLDADPDVAEAKWAQMPTSKRQAMLRSTLGNRR
jgi:hypothetical protein